MPDQDQIPVLHGSSLSLKGFNDALKECLAQMDGNADVTTYGVMAGRATLQDRRVVEVAVVVRVDHEGTFDLRKRKG